MGKKNRYRKKKESPWKDIPVTPYEKTLSLGKQAKKDPVLKEALKVRKEQRAIQKLLANSGRTVGRVQYVPVEEKIKLISHTKDGKKEEVIVKVKTKKMKRINHIK